MSGLLFYRFNMNISDRCPEYFAAAMAGVEIPQGLTSEKFLRRGIKSNALQFSYGNATYNDYQVNYRINEQAIRDRKWVAIPNALLAGACKTVYDLSNAVFKGINGDSRGFAINMYRAARDLEEAYGWIVTLFDDVLGSYHVQQSLFHKECYSYFERTPRESSVSYYHDVRVPYCSEAMNITLKAFYEMDEATQEGKIELFELEEVIASFGGKEVFFRKLAEANQEALALVDLVDLKLEGVQPKISYVIMTDVDFKALTLGQIKDANASQMKVISERLKQFADEPALVEIPEDIMSVPAFQFDSIPGSRITQQLDVIPPAIFPLFSDAQIQEVDFANASKEQVDCLFDLGSNERVTQRLELLSTPQFQDVLGKLSLYKLKLIPNERLSQLDLSVLDERALNGGLLEVGSNPKIATRLGCLHIDQLQSILGKLNPYKLRLIPNERLPQLDLSVLGKDALNGGLLEVGSNQEIATRLGCLHIDQLQSILGKLNHYKLKLIPNAQLPQLDLSVLDESALNGGLLEVGSNQEIATRLGCLGTHQLQSILSRLKGSCLRCIEGEALGCLDISGLLQEQINALFPTLSRDAIRQEGSGFYCFHSIAVNGEFVCQEEGNGYSEQKIDSIISERTRAAQVILTALTEDQINSIRDKLSPDHLALIESLAVVNA